MAILKPTPNKEPDFEITNDGKYRVGTDNKIYALVAETAETRMFKRNGVRLGVSASAAGIVGEEEARTQWLVMELNGVRCYIKRLGDQTQVLMTTEDLYP